jgi:hypothetical protein
MRQLPRLLPGLAITSWQLDQMIKFGKRAMATLKQSMLMALPLRLES